MQYKITCVQLEKNSANYLHRRDIHLISQTVSFGNISLFSSYVTISPDYFPEMQLIINYNYILLCQKKLLWFAKIR